MMLSISSLLVGHLYTFFGKLIQVPCPFLNWVIFLVNCIYFVLQKWQYVCKHSIYTLFLLNSLSLKKFMSLYILILHCIIFNSCTVSHWMDVKYHKWPVHPIFWHLCHFWFFTIMNKAKMTLYPYLCAHDYFVGYEYIPQHETAESKHEPNLGDLTKLPLESFHPNVITS